MLLPAIAFAQFKTQMIYPGKNYTNNTNDTLVITLKSKIEAALIYKKERDFLQQENDKYNEIITNLNEQVKTLEEKSATQNELISSYQTQLEGSETHAKEMVAEAKRQRRQKFLAMGVGAVGIVLAILL